MFIAREKELTLLKNELLKDSSATLIYGKRKVGKTTLILEASKRCINKTVIYYECIKDTIDNNIKRITIELKRIGIMPSHFTFETNTFEELFRFLDNCNKQFIVVIDEYCYLKEYEKPNTVDSIFQTIIDNSLNHINLFISGSHISMMRDLLNEKNALFGRFTCALELTELNYLDSSLFYSELTPYNKVALYSVFGGSPYILKEINYKKSLKENIIELLLNKSNPVFLYADSLLLTDMNNKASIDRVLGTLKNSKKHYKELEDVLDRDRTGNLSKMLKPLLDFGLIQKEYPINKMNSDKRATYQINDNILRFYYTYIFPHKYLLDRMSPEDFFNNFINESLIDFISRRFEEICREYIWLLTYHKKLIGVFNVGSYYYDDPINHLNGEFDLAIEKKESYDLIEVKYLKDKLNSQIINKEIMQIKKITEINIDKIGFISINGFKHDDIKLDYMFDGNDLYNIEK